MKSKSISRCLALLLILTGGLKVHGASTFQFEYSRYEANEGTPSVLVAVLRSGDLAGPASVEVASLDVNATDGEDYEAINLTVEFADGQDMRTCRVPLLNDGAEEASEQFRLILSNPSEGATVGAPSRAMMVIEDNDPGAQFPWQHFWGYERDGQITVTVERGNDVELSSFTVNYATSDLTALAGLDYTAVSGTLEFAAGEMTQTISIPIADDAEAESREAFRLTLSDSTGPGGLGPDTTTTVWLYDTTGHQPRHFGTPSTRPAPSRLMFVLPLWGHWDGSRMPWYELYAVEASADLRAWQPGTWFAWSPASGDPPPVYLESLAWQIEPGQPAEYCPNRFFRLAASPFMAVWPPPSSDIFAHVQPERSVDVHYPDRPLGIGYTERWITDPKRRNRYGISDNGTFRVSIWYPASVGVGAVPRRFLSSEVAHFWWDNWSYHADAPSPDLVTYSFEDAAFRAGETQHPVILYSHAGNPWASGAHEVWNHAEYLAQHGFVVVAPHHYDCWETALPDGSFYAVEIVPERSAAGFQDRMRDFEVLRDAMTEWQVSDPLLAGRLDLANLASMGYQWGVGVAAELCRTVDVCRAGVLLHIVANSWTGVDTPLAAGLDRPMMFIQETTNSRKDLYVEMEADAVWFQLAGGTLDSLLAWYPWNNPLYSDRPSDQNLIDGEVCRTLQAYVASFLKSKMGLDDDTLWEGPSEDHPKVINYERK